MISPLFKFCTPLQQLIINQTKGEVEEQKQINMLYR